MNGLINKSAAAEAAKAGGQAGRMLRRLAAACLLPAICLFPAPAIAQAPATASGTSQAQSAAQAQAEVVLDGRKLFGVRGVSAYPATERAAAISARILAVAADASIPVESLRVAEDVHVSAILAGDRELMKVLDADAEAEAVSRKVLAEIYRNKIARAVAAYRHERSSEALRAQSLHAGGATLFALALILALRRFYPRLSMTVMRRMGVRIEELEKGSFHLIEGNQLWHALQGAFVALRALLTAVILYVWLNYVLLLYPWTRQAARVMSELVLDPLRTMGAAIVRDIPDIAFLAVLAAVTHYFLNFARLFFAGIEQGKISIASIDSELVWPTYRIVRFLVIILALVVAYPYIPGSETNAFKGISIFLGLVFSLGSTSVIGNVIAGYAMIYRRAFKIGDRIQVGEVLGDVVDRRILVTKLRSVKNEEIVIPNTEILNRNIINYSALARSNGLILHTTVGIGYETPWRQVEAMLREAAARTPGLLAAPQPFILQKGLGDFCVNYEINAYTDRPLEMYEIQTELHRNILDVFNEYGVQIMTPAYVADTAEAKVVPKDRWYAAPARPEGGS